MDKARAILKNQFGFDEFRLEQGNVIRAVLDKKDALVLMPTGGGKSLCYQIPALLFPGLTVVISPLIALMKDQVNALKLNGVPAAVLNSTLTAREQSEVLSAVRRKEIKLLYLAPERFFSQDEEFIDFLKSLEVSLFAIDEAHCISHWGHDFRPEYLKLSALKRHFPSIPVAALTATADDLTRKDILDKLHLNSPEIFISSFDRKNIHYFIEPKKESKQRLLAYLEGRREDSGIIYTLSRQSAENLAATLEREGFSAKPYHAGLDKDIRDTHQDLFIQDQVKIIVATIAFGMGIDKSNVRYVVHMDVPKNIEGYYQETGRAGRDGLKSEALLFYSLGDVMKLKRFAQIEGNPSQSQVLLKKLNQMARFCEAKAFCRRKALLNYFGESYPDRCDACDVCLGRQITVEVLKETKSATSPPVRTLSEIPYEADLFKRLKTTRLDLAHKAGVPAFVVFSDATLVELAAYLPQTLSEMRDISGFGEVKLAKYGSIFLEEVSRYSQERGLSSRMNGRGDKRQIRDAVKQLQARKR